VRWEKNTNRPYFEGHERDDVVVKRIEFIDYFQKNKDLYYYPHCPDNNDKKVIDWNIPTRHKRILISHDESTFRSGEMSLYRWISSGFSSFFNKGKGRSIMVSGFITMHSSVDIFKLDDIEWKEAVENNPELLIEDSFLNYYQNSANAFIEPKKDNYFDNKTILRQFERLFKLLKYKKAFKDHEIEIIVDNARTHSAKIYDINKFHKRQTSSCEYDLIEWIDDNGVNQSIKCRDENDKYKGLVQILKELNIIHSIKEFETKSLAELRSLLSSHPAFNENTQLEKLASKYGIRILWCPKFHCELNPIEGLWCDLKWFVRKWNEQEYNKLNSLIIEAMDQYEEKKLNKKLWLRFWRALEMYESGSSYQDVLHALFGAKSTANVQTHKKNDRFNTLLN